MLSAIVIDQDVRYVRMPLEQSRDRRLDQQRQLGLRKESAQGGKGRLGHHGVADPVGPPHHNPPNGVVTHGLPSMPSPVPPHRESFVQTAPARSEFQDSAA